MAAFLADLEAGYDLFTSPIGVEPDELDGPFAGDPGEWPGAAGAAGAPPVTRLPVTRPPPTRLR